MIDRPFFINQVLTALKRAPVVALLGPRQCGKTTLARMIAGDDSIFFDLEAVSDRRRLQNPELVLGAASGTVILDEIQAMPELFPVLRVLADRPGRRTRFLILGSASPHIVANVSESLAGRVEFIELSGFILDEVSVSADRKLWVRGGFPRSFLAKSEVDSLAWREGFIRTFLERDIPQLGIRIAAAALRRFWTMLAHYHGQTWNGSELGRSLGLSDKTVRSYLDVLTGTFMVRQLQPWHENIAKRQVKAPKLFLRDSGILHALLTLNNLHELIGHPRVGASWEGFALEQVLQSVGPSEAFFWATHGGAELDLMFMRGGRRYGVEFKFSEAPKATRSLHTAILSLQLEHVWIVCPGKHVYPIDEKITVCPLKDIKGIAAHIK
ncbi:MAG TPA: ATP-binding protein [Dissulfurispiraceae bacterium]|nr:ATP-binding protein [Dissulfurispiraceae bacterium]